MTIRRALREGLGTSLERSREEHLRWDRPLPPMEEMAIEDLTDEEWQTFW